MSTHVAIFARQECSRAYARRAISLRFASRVQGSPYLDRRRQKLEHALPERPNPIVTRYGACRSLRCDGYHKQSDHSDREH